MHLMTKPVELEATTSNRIISRLMSEFSFTRDLAAATLTETLVYLQAVSMSSQPLAPSKLVDSGWHTFLLYTREYTDYCNLNFGQYIHHCPNENADVAELPISRTVGFFESHGLAYNPALWNSNVLGADCDGGGYGGGGSCKGQCS